MTDPVALRRNALVKGRKILREAELGDKLRLLGAKAVIAWISPETGRNKKIVVRFETGKHKLWPFNYESAWALETAVWQGAKTKK